MSNFTQEPWKLLPPAFPHAPYTIQTTVHETGPGCWACETIASVDSEANGRLIAAAPEMYELLQTIYDEAPILVGNSELDDFVAAIHEIRNLLARIDGEASND